MIVVDDGSTDDTADVARGCGDGTGRLSVVRLDLNRGPSAARNVALATVSMPYAAILDADDFITPYRFGAMLASAGTDWDFLADDLLLVPDALLQADEKAVMADIEIRVAPPRRVLGDLTAETFIRGNISRPGLRRRELGFLKPLMSMAFLRQHGISYDETVRLGEDYVLYAQALIAGARFRLVEACGYIAVDRSDSLSSRHRTSDHARMVEVDAALMNMAKGEPGVQSALKAHQDAIQRKLDHRVILDKVQERGRLAALLSLARMPGSAWYILSEAVKARIGTAQVDEPDTAVRLLIGTTGRP